MPELTVALHGAIIGHLRGAGADFDFRPTPEAVRTWGMNSRMLSLAVPLLPRPPASGRALRRSFFAELLPEGDARERLANEARVRKDDIMGMLAAFGRDVAGAVQIWDTSAPGEPRTPAVEPLDDSGVRTMLENVAIAPLGNKPRRGKTSLNGVQPKVVLVRTDDGWARAVDGWPSTHIAKPVVPKYPSMIFDEEYGSRFARALGHRKNRAARRRRASTADADALSCCGKPRSAHEEFLAAAFARRCRPPRPDVRRRSATLLRRYRW